MGTGVAGRCGEMVWGDRCGYVGGRRDLLSVQGVAKSAPVGRRRAWGLDDTIFFLAAHVQPR